MTRRLASVAVCLSLSLYAVDARAQAYLSEPGTEPYDALGSDEGTTLLTDSDDGFVEVTLPFALRFYGRPYSTLWVSANGGVSFVARDPITQVVSALPGQNVVLPSIQAPNAVIAVAWDDWVVTGDAPGGGGRVAWAVRGEVGDRRLFIDWQRMQPFGASGAGLPAFSFQLVFHETTDHYEVRFGPLSGDGVLAMTATSGAENHQGGAGFGHLDCSPVCGLEDMAPGAGLLLSPNLNPELEAFVSVVGAHDGGLQAAVRIVNTGPSAATDVSFEVRLSQDATLSGDDELLYVPPVSFDVGPRPAETTITVDLSFDPSLFGPHHLIVVVDPDDVVPELNKLNNVASSSPFILGTDLTATMSAMPDAIVGETTTVNVALSNLGVKAASGVVYQLVLVGPLLDEPVVLHTSAPVDLPALSSVFLQAQPVEVPRTFAGGRYGLYVLVDPEDAIAEYDEFNNEGQWQDFELKGPDIAITAIEAGVTSAFQGRTMPVRVELTNKGIARASDFTFSVYLSSNDVITLRDERIYTSQRITLEGLESRSILEAALVPADVEPGDYYVGVIVDAEGLVLEAERSNNVRRTDGTLPVTAPISDLTVSGVATVTTAPAGEPVPVAATVSNVGAADTEFAWAVVLSSNARVSAGDRRLREGRSSVRSGKQVSLSVDVLLPPLLSAGDYTLGVVVDPDNEVPEVDETNNDAAASAPLRVTAPSLSVVTRQLPEAVLGLAYSVDLRAVGATGAPSWKLVGGDLPEGLTLAQSGRISGTPTSPGLHVLVLEVASEGASALATFTLAVRAFAASLGLLDSQLPDARRGIFYRQQLGAEGGTPPYVFTLTGTTPAGLTVDAQGVVSGLALEEGEYSLAVQVEDAAGHRTSGSVALDVIAAGSLSLVSHRLRDPEAGRPYVQPLVIEGGLPPYAVTLFDGALPDGLSVRTPPDGSTASIEGTPTRTGVWSFTLEVTDDRGERDLAHAVMRVSARALSFVELSLPDASPGAEYSYQFETNARPPATYSLAGGALPAGLSMDASGLVSGTVAADVPRRVHAFAVRVVDSTGGVALGAFSVDVPAPRRTTPNSGCSASGGTAGSLLLLVLLAGRGRRRTVGALLAVAVSLSAGDAWAYYRVTKTTTPFVPLTSSTALSDVTSADLLDQSSPVSLPFPFSFYGKAQTTIGVGINGLLTFGSVNASKLNTPLPSPGEPSNFVAPFWDDLQLSKNTPNGPSRTSHAVQGQAPHRVLVVEWKNLQRESSAQSGVDWEAYSFQVRLYEGTNEISIHSTVHATAKTLRPDLSGTVGLENDTGTRATDLSDQRCSPGCSFGAIVHDRLVSLVPSADLRFQSVTAPGTFHADTEVLLRAALLNEGGAEARQTQVTYLLSKDTLPSDDDLVLAQSVPVTVPAASPSSISTRVTVGDAVQPGIYQLLARVTTSAEEVSVANNLSEPLQVVVTPAAADFVVTRLLGTPTSRPGATYEYTRTIKNNGNDTGSGELLVVLSTNDHASMADLELERSAFALTAGASLDETKTVTLPASLAPGRYWLGLIVSAPDDAPEIDPLNNVRILGPIALEGGPLTIVQTALPEVVAGVPFAIELHAAGGAGDYQWSVGTPSLPPGVTLSTSGTLSGVVDANGDFPVRVQLHSAGSIVSKLFTLTSVREHTAVTVVSARLPTGTFGVSYQASLVARGGTPPYAWSVAGNGAPPAGLGLASDGTLEGRPAVDGEARFVVEVMDSTGVKASGEIVVPLAGPVRPLFGSAALATGVLEEDYEARVVGVGGVAPYVFTVVESRRLATATGDQARTFIGALPPGLTLSDDGLISGRPSSAGVYAVSLRLVDDQAHEDTATFVFTVRSDASLSILTASLPDAIVGEPYDARLSSTGDAASVTWTMELLDGMALPGGLTLLPEGQLVGLPLVTGHAGFLAIARDTSGHFAARPLAVRVVEAPAVESEGQGCSQAGAVGLASLLTLLLLRTRRRQAAGLVVLVAALGLGATTGCTSAPASACAVACGDGWVCDALDGLCKCGSAGGAVCAPGETCDAASRSCLAATCDTGCPTGTQCGDDGACHCGVASGVVCEAGEACNELGRCEAVDACAGVVCSAGSTCDPEAAGACRCGVDGLTCEDGERCVDSACVPDLCVGVACTGGTVCDPSDGQCRCGGAGGALCLSGEACDAARGACERSDACAAVDCAAGSTCDPADGQCRCGGPGGPACAADQTCSPLSRVCEGGDLCRSTTCANGASCDPEDGTCKCGGFGGITCGASELCVVDGPRLACERPCDFGVQACGAGTTCRFDELAATSICKPVGQMVRGEECAHGAPCAAGLHCVKTSPTSVARCRDYCTSSDACLANAKCRPFLPGEALGACVVEGL